MISGDVGVRAAGAASVESFGREGLGGEVRQRAARAGIADAPASLRARTCPAGAPVTSITATSGRADIASRLAKG